MTEKSDTARYVQTNLTAWNEVAPIHEAHNQAQLEALFRQPGASCLDETATAMLKRLAVSGKDVAQVCCNNGRELISVRNLGAARCVGFDGAQGFVDQGRALAQAAGQDVEFVCCDAYDLPSAYHHSFDLVVITIGVLGWMPDLDGFFDGVAKLLRPGGAIFIYEHHPVVVMMKPGAAEDPVEWELSYFRTEPYVDDSGLDYWGDTEYEPTPNVSFCHKMSDILMAGVRAGLRLEHFEELPHHISNTWYNVEQSGIELPMCYTLVFRKPLT